MTDAYFDAILSYINVQLQSLDAIAESGADIRGDLQETWNALYRMRWFVATERPPRRLVEAPLKKLAKKVRALEKRYHFQYSTIIATALGVVYETPAEKAERLAALKNNDLLSSYSKCSDPAHGCTHFDRFLAVGTDGHEKVCNPVDISQWFTKINTGLVAVIADDPEIMNLSMIFFFPGVGNTCHPLLSQTRRSSLVTSGMLVVPEPIRYRLHAMLSNKSDGMPRFGKVCVEFVLHFPTGTTHGNVLTFNQMQHTYTRFEPHGDTPGLYDSLLIDAELRRLPERPDMPFLDGYTYVAPSDYLPAGLADAIQTREHTQQTIFPTRLSSSFATGHAPSRRVDIANTGGTCQMWCILYIYTHARHPFLSDRDVFDILNRRSANELAILVRSFIAWNKSPDASNIELELEQRISFLQGIDSETNRLNRKKIALVAEEISLIEVGRGQVYHETDEHKREEICMGLTHELRCLMADFKSAQLQSEAKTMGDAARMHEKASENVQFHLQEYEKKVEKWRAMTVELANAEAVFAERKNAYSRDKNGDTTRWCVVDGLKYHKIFSDCRRFLHDAKAVNRNISWQSATRFQTILQQDVHALITNEEHQHVLRQEWMDRQNKLRSSFQEYERERRMANPLSLSYKSAVETFLKAYSDAEEFLAQVKDVLPDNDWKCGTPEMKDGRVQCKQEQDL